jgi:Ca2+-binding RTX toxin-like protein
MPLSITIRDVDYVAGGLRGGVMLYGAPGPASVTIDWGSNGPGFTDPRSQVFEPVAFTGGDFFIPVLGGYRAFADGDYLIKASAMIGGLKEMAKVGVFFAVGATDGQVRAGNGFADAMIGGAGHDSLSGSGGNDMLLGGAGDDTLAGGAGDDTLVGHAGDDSLAGGTGQDVLFGYEGDDTLSGQKGDDSLYGGLGDDLLNGGDGADVLVGGDGADTLLGGAGADNLDGGAGSDRLSGGGGNDTFEGGQGNDTLISDMDGLASVFRYQGYAWSNEGVDRIQGFEAGIDRIQIVNADFAGLSAARFVGSAAAMTDTGLWIIYEAGTGRLSLHFEGDGPAVQIAKLVGAPALGFGDVLLG